MKNFVISADRLSHPDPIQFSVRCAPKGPLLYILMYTVNADREIEIEQRQCSFFSK